MKPCIVIIVFLIFLGCQSIKPVQTTASSTVGALSSTTLDDYSGTLSIPQKVKVNEEFTIKAELKTELEQKVTISSKQQMFVYVIKDRNGKQINSYAITDKGKNREVSGKVVISENYKYKIKQPGIYEISAIAEFTVIKDGKSQNFKIETDSKQVEIE
ncbi:hypothetical protein [Paenibacillus sp. JJ-223]|uniref:hypothetical protein n=1 Tax=Paenibacillus sp. JJ-223 TaxID=2905647 RepID=UPI001F1A1FCA|nr:hypothetical protein [Paenibacillus sp. JJ-223]CAH1211397.1 hypothetical protein PAECIP111890_03722 [Paenibacillus sp. JJ-223]